MRAAVIGAGLAGLSAADALAREGWEVDVIEARDRVGGRAWSRRLANGAVIELGAEFILAGNTEVRALAAELGLGLWDKGMRYGDREPRGGIGTTKPELAETVGEVDRALAEGAAAGSVRDLLEALAIDPGAREAILARAEISSASSADEIPAADLAGLAHIDAEAAPSVAGGNQGLALGLAERLGDAVALGDPAVAIDWWPAPGGAAVTVRTESRRQVEADAAVVAVPANVIAAIDFEPSLPTATRAALGLLRYGHAAKLFVPLAEPVEPSAVIDVPNRYWCWTATGEDDRPMPVVSCFSGSPAALARLRVAEGPETWVEALAGLRPDLPLERSQALLQSWDADPWVRAAYSVSPPAELAAALRERVGPLAFAGEHTGGEFSGLMEGALRSGRRAAGELLASLG